MDFFNPEYNYYKETGVPIEREEIAFETYRKYLHSVTTYIEKKYDTYNNLIGQLLKIEYMQIKKDKDIAYLGRFLHIAWNTEHLCINNDNYTKNNIELVRVNNQWKPIQAYYSIYSLCEACCYAMDKKIENHSKCLEAISDVFCKNSKYKSLTPWSLGYSGYRGNEKNKSTIKSINFSTEIIPAHQFEHDPDPEQLIARCIHAEHIHRIEDYKRHKGGILKYYYDPGFSTLFHFLFRLRKKSNYENIDIFVTQAPASAIKSFSDNLTTFINYTAIVLECMIINKIGYTPMFGIIDAFPGVKTDRFGIGKRYKKYRSFVANSSKKITT